MHAAGEDLRICRFQTGTAPRAGLRRPDRRRAGRLRLPALARATWSRRRSASRSAGGETRTDWRRRPLSHGAAPLRPRRRPLPARAGRPARGPARRAGAGRTGPRRSSASFVARDRRTGSTRSAGGACRACTSSAVAGWRSPGGWPSGGSSEARRPNRPLRQVLRDDLLVAIAKRQPTSRRDLEALRDFNRPHLLSRATRSSPRSPRPRPCPPTSCPSTPSGTRTGPGLTMVVSLLAAALAHCCAESKVAAGLVGIDGRPEGPDPLARPGPARRSRAPACPRLARARSAARPCSTSSPAAVALRVVDPDCRRPRRPRAVAGSEGCDAPDGPGTDPDPDGG